jgi:integrase
MSSRLPLSAAEEQRVLTVVRGSWSLRNRALIEFGLRTGFRAAELAALTVQDVWDGAAVRAEVSLARCHLKNGRGARRASVRSRTVPLASGLRELLQAYLAWRRQQQGGALSPVEPLFRSTQRPDRGIGRWMINRLVQRACMQAGLLQHGRWGSHTLRKSFAQAVYAASGHDINLTRAALAHRDIATTQRYLTITEEALRTVLLSIPA